MTMLPPLPTAPPAGATAAERQAFDDAMAVYRAAAGALHAQAQADTATAMQASVAAQAALAAAMSAPAASEVDMRRAMLLDLVARQPHHLTFTEVSFTATAKKIVDEIFKHYPVVAP